MHDLQLKIEYLPAMKLKPYEKNTRRHEKIDVDNIAKSIKKYGMNDPIGIWGKDNLIVEGHGRLLACKQLGIEQVPVVRLDHMSEKERREYAIAHNATAELSQWDFDILQEETEDLDLYDFDFDFDFNDFENFQENTDEEFETNTKYTMKRDAPQYEIQGEAPEITDLININKSQQLKEEIKNADIPEEVKNFLYISAERHNVFNYEKIAEFYACAEKNIQELMEKSALVIIDFDDAIKNGYVKLCGKLEALKNDET